MGFGHWLKGATRIRFDNRTLGNLIKNGAIAGGTALGGPLGLAVAGAGSAAGQKALGGSWKDAAGAGLKGAATAGTLHAGMGAAKGLLNHGAGSAASAAPGALPNSTIPSGTGLVGGGDPGFAGHALSAGGKALKFAEAHPNATAGALNAVSGLATAGSQNRMAGAQADLLEKQAEETEYEFQQRKARDAALAPTWSALGSTIGGNYANVAANPYLPRA